MNEIISREEFFLKKLKAILDTFESIDKLFEELNEMIEEQPENQSRIDQLLSDYYHRLENDDLNDTEIINIGKKIHDVRIDRNDANSVSKLIHCYETNKNKLQYTNKYNRQMFCQAMANVRKNLHEDYKYRILTDEDLQDLSKGDKLTICVDESNNLENEKEFKPQQKRKYKISKESLEECLNQGLKLIEIAEKFGVQQPYVSLLKKKYGLNKEKK